VVQVMIEFSHFPTTTVWGLFTRALGFVYLIAIGSFFSQIIPFAGEGGIAPARLLFRKIKEDFPSIKRFFYFPSYCWINQSDLFLKSLILMGMFSSVVVIVGGPYSPLALFVC